MVEVRGNEVARHVIPLKGGGTCTCIYMDAEYANASKEEIDRRVQNFKRVAGEILYRAAERRYLEEQK